MKGIFAFVATIVSIVLTSPTRVSAQQRADSAFRDLQERGKRVMGVDQYTSSHVFQSLPDGGRIELQRDVADSLGTRVIRAHMQDIAARFTAGDFSLSAEVHGTHAIPGTATMRSSRATIRYVYRELPRGGEVRLTSSDAAAIKAIHEFLAFQRSDHRTEHKHPQGNG
jgi:hypothetical protein